MQVPPFSLEKQLSNLGQEINLAVSRTLQSGQYIGGEEVKSFERAFAESVCVPYAVSCNSGTDALILALRALDIGPGDEVITVSFSFFATAEAISNVGATPVFVDVDFDTFLIDHKLIKEAITPFTKAILPVHLFGSPVDMTAITAIAQEYGLKVIEDCAQAAGTLYNNQPVGSFGDVGCFSFFPTKNLGSAGDGGAITTHDFSIAERIRELSVHGMPMRYLHTSLGYNSRLDAVQASVLNVKLPYLPKWINQRIEIASRYIDSLKEIPFLKMPIVENTNNSLHSYNQFVVKVNKDFIDESLSKDLNPLPNNILSNLPDSRSRDWLKNNLSNRGVHTIIYYPIPIHLQPAYQNDTFDIQSLKNSEKLSSQVLSLPMFPELSIDMQDYVIQNIRELLLNIS